MISIAIVTVCALLLVVVLFVVWSQRSQAEERAAANEERAAVADAVHAIAHDLDSLFAILLANLSTAHDLPRDELDSAIKDVEDGTRRAKLLVRAMRGDRGTRVENESIVGVLEVLAALHRRRGVPLELTVEGDVRFSGAMADAFRALHNLITNAAREVEGRVDAVVSIVVRDGELRVTNPVRPGARELGAWIYDRGASASGSSGMGLHIAKSACDALDLDLTHRVSEDARPAITFLVRPRRPAEAEADTRATA